MKKKILVAGFTDVMQMPILECPDCGVEVARHNDLLAHVKTDHLSVDSIPAGHSCPECKNDLSSETLPFHLPCLIGLDPDVIPSLRGCDGFMCSICATPFHSQNELERHVKNHSTIDRKAVLTDSITCSVCNATVDDASEVRNHIQCLHDELSGGSRYECPACGEPSNSKEEIQWHIWIDHWGAEGFQTRCPGCDKKLQIDEIRQHIGCIDGYDSHDVMDILSTRRKHCHFCDHEAFNYKRLAEHVRENHLEELAIDHRCPGCDVELQNVSDRKLKRHYPSLAQANNLDFSFGEPAPLLGCPDCHQRVDDFDELVYHVQTNHEDLLSGRGDCKKCGRPVDRGAHLDCILADSGRTSIESTESLEQLSKPPGLSPYPPSDTQSITAKYSLDEHDRDSYFDELRSFIELEREATRQEAWRKYRETPIHQLKYSTNLILDLVPIGKRPNPDVEVQYVFERPVPEEEEDPAPLTERFGIFPRSEVILGSSEQGSSLPIKATVTFTDDQTIGFAPDVDGEDWNRLHKALTRDDEAYHCVHLLNPRPYDREYKAIQKVQAGSSRPDLIAGTKSLSETRQTFRDVYSGLLNSHQATAVGRALGTDDVVCIHGPPGTGKTRTLTALIELAVARGDRVLACAHSNPATDNLLVGSSTIDDPDEDSLHATVQSSDLTMARFGHHSTNEVVKEFYAGQHPGNADIVGSTTNAAADLEENEFDIVVVDEATQASQPATFVPWLKGERLILAGDHRQLPPYCSDESAKEEEMHISLFEHLLDAYGTDIAERLAIQYRMNEQIAEFPSRAFYDRTLKHGERNRDWRIDDLSPLVGIDITGTEDKRENTHSRYNETEASVAAMSARLLVNEGMNPQDIGIITPYTGQIGVIASSLQEVDIEGHEKIKIDTVDSFQGSEKEAIIVSFVRSNSANSSGFLAFPDEGKRRLNVAITRARKRLVLIGDWDTLGTVASHRSPEESCADVYADLASYLAEQDCMQSIEEDSLSL